MKRKKKGLIVKFRNGEDMIFTKWGSEESIDRFCREALKGDDGFMTMSDDNDQVNTIIRTKDVIYVGPIWVR